MTGNEMTPALARKSDLGVRTLSAIVMLAVAGGALWLGGWWWAAFCALVAVGVLWEWSRLVRGFASPRTGQVLWILGGIAYVGIAIFALFSIQGQFEGTGSVLIVVCAVIGTDIGAYFAGRAIGGPKIAPSISPSKTWAGLFGGMLGASALILIFPLAWEAGLCRAFYPRAALPPGVFQFDGPCSGLVGFYPPHSVLLWAILTGSIIAVVAQIGDFFESWMKRKAGVKDSSHLIPGHGGLFDRVDGLLAVFFVYGVLLLVGKLVT
jgi:phosphatidate cytidylyltransferase